VRLAEDREQQRGLACAAKRGEAGGRLGSPQCAPTSVVPPSPAPTSPMTATRSPALAERLTSWRTQACGCAPPRLLAQQRRHPPPQGQRAHSTRRTPPGWPRGSPWLRGSGLRRAGRRWRLQRAGAAGGCAGPAPQPARGTCRCACTRPGRAQPAQAEAGGGAERGAARGRCAGQADEKGPGAARTLSMASGRCSMRPCISAAAGCGAGCGAGLVEEGSDQQQRRAARTH